MAGGRLSRRAVALLVAFALAILATLSLVSYIRGIETRALRRVESVDAFVAKEIIAEGSRGEDVVAAGLIERKSVPRQTLPEGAIRVLTEIQGKVAGVDILKGEVIVGARFVEPQQVAGRLPIPPDRQAISLEVGVPQGVAGFIEPGSRVSIIAQLAGAAGGAPVEARVQYFLQNVQVLAVGNLVISETPPEGEQVARGLLTLALTPVEAEKLVYALLHGSLYFTLLPPDQQPVETPGRTAENAFS